MTSSVRILLQFAFLLALPLLGLAQGYKPGDKARDFNLKATSGSNVSLQSAAGPAGAIVIFTCNHCPFSKAYEDRIIALHGKYAAQGLPVIAINPNDPTVQPEDNFDAMVQRAKDKKFPFVYAQDAGQEIAKAYGATRTPHVFLLKRNGKDFTVSYIGAIDNNPNEPESVSEKYLEQAADALLANKPITNNMTKSIGCGIKWKKA